MHRPWPEHRDAAHALVFSRKAWPRGPTTVTIFEGGAPIWPWGTAAAEGAGPSWAASTSISTETSVADLGDMTWQAGVTNTHP